MPDMDKAADLVCASFVPMVGHAVRVRAGTECTGSVAVFDYANFAGIMSREILKYLMEKAPHVKMEGALRSFRSMFMAFSGEPFMVQFELGWEANPAKNVMSLTNPAEWTPAHCATLVDDRGAPSAAVAAARHIIACITVPAHEMVHFVQHHHGVAFGSRDSDRRSYSAEHDASRLSLSIMWQVLHRPPLHSRLPPWFPFMCLAFESNDVERERVNLKSKGKDEELWVAYRRWTSSFGLESPVAVMERLRTTNSVDSSFKGLVAVEGFTPVEDDLEL